GDGAPDIAVADSLDHDVALLKGRGDGTFFSAGRVPAGPTPRHIRSGDFNRDGRPDLVTVGEGCDVRVLLGRGLLRFAPAQEVAFLSHGDSLPDGLVAEDFDGDGQIDFAVGVNERFTVLRNVTP